MITCFTMPGALLVQYAIENALHYQRCREIIYVLHMVSLASIQHPEVFNGAAAYGEDKGLNPISLPRDECAGVSGGELWRAACQQEQDAKAIQDGCRHFQQPAHEVGSAHGTVEPKH